MHAYQVEPHEEARTRAVMPTAQETCIMNIRLKQVVLTTLSRPALQNSPSDSRGSAFSTGPSPPHTCSTSTCWTLSAVAHNAARWPNCSPPTSSTWTGSRMESPRRCRPAVGRPAGPGRSGTAGRRDRERIRRSAGSSKKIPRAATRPMQWASRRLTPLKHRLSNFCHICSHL